MGWLRHDRLDVAAIAVGGVLGATVRWLITRTDAATGATGGWFTYAPNIGTAAGGPGSFEPVRSAETIAVASGIPVDTLAVNLAGCLVIGALSVMLLLSAAPRRALLGAATGFCGSLTTFSTVAVELAILLRGKPVLPPELDGFDVIANRSIATALVYLGLSLAGGALAFWLGRYGARRLVTPPGDVTFRPAGE